jgi:hypothetical protein
VTAATRIEKGRILIHLGSFFSFFVNFLTPANVRFQYIDYTNLLPKCFPLFIYAEFRNCPPLCLVSRQSIMGDASSKKEDVLLCVLPFPEPADIIGRIRKNHPWLKVVYRQIQFTNFRAPIELTDNVPEGE